MTYKMTKGWREAIRDKKFIKDFNFIEKDTTLYCVPFLNELLHDSLSKTIIVTVYYGYLIGKDKNRCNQIFGGI